MANMAMILPLTQKATDSPFSGQTSCVVERSHLKDLATESDLMQLELPPNFGEVVKGIYRSAFPSPRHLPALKSLGLRTIITLVEEPYEASHLDFLKENRIAHLRIIVQPNKDLAEKTPDHVINGILEILLDKANHPVLIHCNKGKHRTGCVVACFRKVQGWKSRDIQEEYLSYSRLKSRVADLQFIEQYDASTLDLLAECSGVKSWTSTSDYRHQEPGRTRYIHDSS
ncbi:tyrosine phosphatase family-domain-containing protein [Aspergillus avenaceus]|uniref:diphosphoinositol-polyphosphate diphosphatase n=1 Tax=Aspergillus avenaceus TaxID=36643 RepID=A0A5N6TK39_ASPAV|nr:tyrosine phosphatase family-domain-containing protein [Aspergillus avenaceus]